MSNIKNFDPAQYESHFEAVKHFVHEGRREDYDFSVSTKEAAENALAYLCINDIPHHYHSVGGVGLYITTIGWEENGQEFSYSFWHKGDI